MSLPYTNFLTFHLSKILSGGSGLNVIGPPPPATSRPTSSSVFGQLQAQARKASADDISGENVYTVTKYRNGYTINDGELLDAESVEGMKFFERLHLRQFPREIEELEAAKGQPTSGPDGAGATVVLVDKLSEDYVKKVDSQLLFKPQGASIGRSAPCGDCLVFTESTTSLTHAGAAPVHDPAQPSTQLVVRGPDNKTHKFKVNLAMPVSKLGSVLVQLLGLPHGGDKGFTVNTGFPAKCIHADNADKTVAEIGLTNASMSQIMR